MTRIIDIKLDGSAVLEIDEDCAQYRPADPDDYLGPHVSVTELRKYHQQATESVNGPLSRPESRQWTRLSLLVHAVPSR